MTQAELEKAIEAANCFIQERVSCSECGHTIGGKKSLIRLVSKAILALNDELNAIKKEIDDAKYIYTEVIEIDGVKYVAPRWSLEPEKNHNYKAKLIRGEEVRK